MTMKNDKTLPIVLSNMCESKLFGKFLSLISFVGSLVDCVTAAGQKYINLNLHNFEAFEKLYFKRFGKDVNFKNNKNATKYALELFQELFGEQLQNSNSFSTKYLHPVISKYTNALMCQSSFPLLYENIHVLYSGERTFIKPGELDSVITNVSSALPGMDIVRKDITSPLVSHHELGALYIQCSLKTLRPSLPSS